MITPKTLVKPKDYLLVEQADIPLELTKPGEYNVIDPITGEPYNGIILQGIFADLRNENANVNNRYYNVERYLEILELFRAEVHSKKGVYGEYEHPKSYAVNPDRISHKILDVWYDATTQLVMGVIILMDTPTGLIAQQIVRTGGQIAISARAAGTEQKNPDGSITGFLKLISTFDIVYYPGFKVALLDYVAMNESVRPVNKSFGSKRIVYYESDLVEIEKKRTEYISMNESINGFQNWLISNMNESVQKPDKQQKQEKILQQKQAPGTQQAQNNLKKATDNDLSESRKNGLNQMYQAQQMLKQKLNKY